MNTETETPKTTDTTDEVAKRETRTVLERFVKRFDERFDAWIFDLVLWLPWTIFLGLLPGLIVWQVLHPFEQMNLPENRITSQLMAALYPGASCLLYLGACFVAHRRRRKDTNSSFAALCRRINRYAAGLLAGPVVFFVGAHPISEEAPLFTMALSVGAAIFAAIAVYGVPRLATLLAPREQWSRWIPLLLVMVLSGLWAAFIIRLELIHHENLGTCDWDFGLYIQSMWKSLHGQPLACTLTSFGNHAYLHFDPILILLSPVLLIHPGPESLIVLQGVWVASGAVPLYLLATRHCRNPWIGVALAIAYLLHPALHGPSMYDFHSLMLAGPLMLWCLHFLEMGAYRRYFVFIGLLLMTREDMSGFAFLIGLYALLGKKSRKVAYATMAVSVLYVIVVFGGIISRGHSYGGYFEELHGENRPLFVNIVLMVATNPLFLVRYLLAEHKLVYILKLVVPLLFLPLFAPKHRILFAFGFLLTIAGSKACLHSISMQYSTWWLPFMFAALPAAIEGIAHGRIATLYRLDASRLRAALLGGLLVSSLVMSVAYGAFVPNPAFKAGYEKLIRYPDAEQQKRAATIKKVQEMIPPNASVMASQHLVSHFAVRDWLWSVDRSGYRVNEPDYAVIWKRDLRSKKEYKVNTRTKNLKMLNDKSKYRRILNENGISVYRHHSME